MHERTPDNESTSQSDSDYRRYLVFSTYPALSRGFLDRFELRPTALDEDNTDQALRKATFEALAILRSQGVLDADLDVLSQLYEYRENIRRRLFDAREAFSVPDHPAWPGAAIYQEMAACYQGLTDCTINGIRMDGFVRLVEDLSE